MTEYLSDALAKLCKTVAYYDKPSYNCYENTIRSCTYIFQEREVINMIGIVSLKDVFKNNETCFGNKAKNLSKIIADVPDIDCVLPGFCITFNMHEDFDNQLLSFRAEIRRRYEELIDTSKTKSVVVRSSAECEDEENALYPGVFQSYSNIHDLQSLFEAIQCCVVSAMSPNATAYSAAVGASDKLQFFTVLVQLELEAEYAGVAFTRIPIPGQTGETMITQVACGSNHFLVKGHGKSNTYTLEEENSGITYKCIQQMFALDKQLEQKIITRLTRLLSAIKHVFRFQLDVEWGYADDKIFVFQARYLKINDGSYYFDRKIHALSEDREQGLKYQAMKFFQKNGFFPKEALFFPQKATVGQIRRGFCSFENQTPFTVRFSHKKDLGLPRLFSNNRNDAIRALLCNKRESWATIAYPSITVRESFEIYMDAEKTILERVPGMWESDSRLAADVMLLKGNTAKMWLVNSVREAKYEDCNGIYREAVQPVGFLEAYAHFASLSDDIKRLRRIFRKDYPINIHFVYDGERFYYLNCRASKKIDWIIQDTENLFVVQDLSDCKNWDGKTAILFGPVLSRGEEQSVISFVPFLKEANVPVFVEFGILSHPAIMLREFGINVIPLYMKHTFFQIDHRDDTLGGNMNIQENPFLTRICFEEQIIENELFSVVRDAEPIVADHFLFYTKAVHPSIADSPYDKAIELIEAFVQMVGKPYAYFERGRASFCTSMNGVQHGHGHLVPKFTADMSGLFPFGPVQCFENLYLAYEACSKSNGQYLLWGNVGGVFYVIENVEQMPKRTIRNSVQKYVNP